METIWQQSVAPRGAEYIFAGDIGGTNTSFALMRLDGRGLCMAGKFLFQTRAVGSLREAVCEAMAEIRRRFPDAGIRGACLSAAGPVRENRCVMTNVSWVISGDELGAALGIPVRVINDFTALSYALPLLDVRNREEITPLFLGGEVPCPSEKPSGKTWAVVGAGTGLGVGCLVESEAGFTAIASEGGHTDFAAADPLSREMCVWLEERIGAVPETELFVSGQGLINIFHFFYERAKAAGGGDSVSEKFREIAALVDREKPACIAQGAACDEGCAEIMRLFVRMYARVAYNVAVTFLPFSGLFLAGGIAGKIEEWFVRDDFFMKSFLAAYRPKIRDMLKSLPVYIIKDYGASLTGAAHAAKCLMLDTQDTRGSRDR
jgi:glucokinase